MMGVSNKVICKHCRTSYHLPERKADDKPVCLDLMRVMTDPFRADEHVWFWSEKEKTLYLNLSCKDTLDMIFLRPGQSILTKGVIREMDVHVKWKCAVCGHVTEINKRIPCLVSEDTRIKLEHKT